MLERTDSCNSISWELLGLLHDIWNFVRSVKSLKRLTISQLRWSIRRTVSLFRTSKWRSWSHLMISGLWPHVGSRFDTSQPSLTDSRGRNDCKLDRHVPSWRLTRWNILVVIEVCLVLRRLLTVHQGGSCCECACPASANTHCRSKVCPALPPPPATSSS